MGRGYRTLRDLEARGVELVAGCRACGRRDPVPISAFCCAFRSWTVEELQRLGAIRCAGCGGIAGASVMGTHWGLASELECWSGSYGYFRPPEAGAGG